MTEKTLELLQFAITEPECEADIEEMVRELFEWERRELVKALSDLGKIIKKVQATELRGTIH